MDGRGGEAKRALTWAFIAWAQVASSAHPALQAGGRGFESHRLHQIAVFELTVGEEHVEGRLIARFDDPAVSDGELGEDGLVEPTPGLAVRSPVGLGAVGGEAHGRAENLLPFAEVGVDGGEASLGGPDVGADAGLLGLQHGDVDGTPVVGVEQLASLALGLGQLAG